MVLINNELQPIRDWAAERGLYDEGDTKTQTLKLMEEMGELAKGIIENDKEEIIDALGDCVVVLVNLAHLKGFHLEDCINHAYNEIKDRKGKMQDGTFIKNK